MKDTDLHKFVLQTYYDLRDQGPFQWIPDEVPEDKWPPVQSFAQLARICSQLAEEDLIEWNPMLGGSGQAVGGHGQIKIRGVRVIEGTEKPPVGFVVNNIHNSNNVQVGNHNSISSVLSVEKFNAAIDQSHFSETEKKEAKSLWQKVCDNKILNTVVGAALGAVAKHALDATSPR